MLNRVSVRVAPRANLIGMRSLYTNFFSALCLFILSTVFLSPIDIAEADTTGPDVERSLTPPPSDGPVIVHVSFLLQDINEIDDEQEQFEFTGLLSLTWKDPRRAFDPAKAGTKEKIYQGDYQFNEITPGWFPQVVLSNSSDLLEKHGLILRVLPDGTSTLIESINATVECDLNMRRYPFDKHELAALFRVHGSSEDEVKLVASPSTPVSTAKDVFLSQWLLHGFSLVEGTQPAPYLLTGQEASTITLNILAARRPLYALRLVALPLVIIVILSWSVFWMERSSLGDRINVSFIGILTAVAYQIVVGDLIPRISYVTLINAFINTSLLTMSATVIMNLVVGECDKRGKSALGDRIDFRCRRIFPLVYFGLILFEVMIAFAMSSN